MNYKFRSFQTNPDVGTYQTRNRTLRFRNIYFLLGYIFQSVTTKQRQQLAREQYALRFAPTPTPPATPTPTSPSAKTPTTTTPTTLPNTMSTPSTTNKKATPNLSAAWSPRILGHRQFRLRQLDRSLSLPDTPDLTVPPDPITTDTPDTPWTPRVHGHHQHLLSPTDQTLPFSPMNIMSYIDYLDDLRENGRPIDNLSLYDSTVN